MVSLSNRARNLKWQISNLRYLRSEICHLKPGGHTRRLLDGQVFEALRAYPRIIVAGIRLIQSATFLFSNENRRQAFGAQTVAIEYPIMSDKAQFFDTGLSYEHSIEWIAVDVLQSTDSDGVWHSDR